MADVPQNTTDLISMVVETRRKLTEAAGELRVLTDELRKRLREEEERDGE